MNDNIGCGAIIFILLLVIFLDIGVSLIYVKSNNAPTSCIFAQDVITCVQISKNK